jgi:hypothetical protein
VFFGCVTASNQTFGAEPANGSAGIARTLCSALLYSPLGATLQQIVAFPVFTAEECDAAGISLLTGYVVAAPPMHALSVALEIDFDPIRHRRGARCDAIRKRTIVFAQDCPTRAGRSSVLGPPALACGACSLAGCSLTARSDPNLCAPRRSEIQWSPQRQGPSGREPREALACREVIGQAEGIGIERKRITPDQTFGVLWRASRHLNIKLRGS